MRKASLKKRMRRTMILLILFLLLLVSILYYYDSNEKYTSVSRERNHETVENKGREKKNATERETSTALPPQSSGSESNVSSMKAGSKREHPMEKGKLVIIIDDAGYSLKDLEPFLDFKGKLTISVLPQVLYSRESAERIKASGKDLLLHLPMEANDGNDIGPGGIYVNSTKEEVFKTIDADFASVPGAAGANNHMGSKVTSDSRMMNMVMEYFHKEKKYFIDSKTTAESKVEKYAEKWNVPVAERDIFMDNRPDEKEIEQWLLKGMKIAEKKGRAILIGHVKHGQIVEVLNRLIPELNAKSIELVGIGDIMGDVRGN